MHIQLNSCSFDLSVAGYRGLVVVGSPKTLWANDNWFKWLEWVKENKAVLHSDRIQQSVDCVPGI